ncbi:MAG TPA: class I SAM-dependent methyltransferase [Pseudomonadales bacterium]
MWDERYRAGHYIYGTEPNDFLRREASRLAPGRVLCLAEGEGRNAVFLAGLGHQVTAVDQSAVGLAKAQQLAAQRGVSITTLCCDLSDYDPGTAQWDAIVSIFCHLPPALRRLVHGRVVEALKPGGLLLLEAYTPAQLAFATGGPPQAEMMMDSRSLAEELAGLDLVYLQELQRDVVEGSHHTGRGAVVQLVAQKPL